MGDLFSYALDSDLTKLRFLRESETIQVLSCATRIKQKVRPWIRGHEALSAPDWYSVLHNKPTYHTPIRPSDWSVLGLAVMAWTATMASLIRVWRSRNSVTCNNLIILAASLTAESEIKSIESRTLAKRYNFTVYRAGPTITGQVARESTW